ncbi:protein tyrosine phosphatase [Bosea caraganae]|uniref:Protein tyrosine phosphatase n=1 Tax=Bosea caraganae TaxID=2763117 RepID=A0A370KZP3_9HYPH|nr:protein-tyrosine phosphatase family protein [Bosea caraganae]RDJ20474.1 protein tyrosine phosphatase [Bosea caraganae]RDJ29989.1 protein tyrosine phosphatase [Bosea caraganae]
MPTLHVSSLSKLHETVAAVGASHVVTLINVNTVVERPPGISAERHLFIGMSDITAPMDGHILPGEEHVERFLHFMRGWDRAAPIVIHCWAGISRSTAAAYIAACALRPERDEQAIALALRAASPSATPNARLVALADQMLRRGGRMNRAIEGIGRGADAFEGAPFRVDLD